MKKLLIPIGWLLGFAFIGWLVCAYFFESISFLQDSRSHSVMSVRRLGGVPVSRSLVFQTGTFDKKLAVWNEGVALAFPHVIGSGETIAVKSGGQTTLIKVLRAERDRLSYEHLELPAKDWTEAQCSSNYIALGGIAVMWSLSRADNIYVYADDYISKPVTSLYQVAYIGGAGAVEALLQGAKQARFATFPWEMGEGEGNK